MSFQNLGEENIKTSIGILKCQHYFVQLHPPDGSPEPLLELWANGSIPPLGIVRARWRDEVLELVEIRTQPSDIPEMLSKTIKGKFISPVPHIAALPTKENKRDKTKVSGSPLASVCAQCHDGDIGGKHLKLESLTTVSGIELALTQVLYHYYTANLVHPHDYLLLQLISQRGKRLTSKPVRFAWAKGSFWVKTDLSGRLVLSLDEIAHQANIRVATRQGKLVLNFLKAEAH